MQSPDNAESSRIISGNSSKLHTPCRQIGLRRKKSRISDTSIKENHSPEIKTGANIKQSENTPKASALTNVSTCAASTDENQAQENSTTPIEHRKTTEKKKFILDAAANRGKELGTQDIKKEVEDVKRRIKEKEDKIAALKLAKLYRRKHDTNTLSKLTEKWREGCQTALQELHSSSAEHGYQINMTQLITQLGIPFHLVHYNPEMEDFE